MWGATHVNIQDYVHLCGATHNKFSSDLIAIGQLASIRQFLVRLFKGQGTRWWLVSAIISQPFSSWNMLVLRNLVARNKLSCRELQKYSAWFSCQIVSRLYFCSNFFFVNQRKSKPHLTFFGGWKSKSQLVCTYPLPWRLT